MKIRQHCLKIFLTGIVLSFSILFSTAANRTASVSGNWSSTATWGGLSVPTAADIVYINPGITVTVNVAAYCSTLTFNSVTTNSTINISGTNSLTVTGLVYMPRPSNNRSSTIAVGAGLLTAGSLTLAATTTGRNNIISVSTGTVTINGTVTTGTTGCQFNFTGAGLLKFGGGFSGGPAALTPSTGTVEYTSATPVIQGFSGSYYNLTFSGSGATTGSGSGAITIQGNLSNTGGGTLNFSSRAVTFSGTASQDIAGFTTTGIVSMTKTSGTATVVGNINGGNLTLNGSSGILDLGAGLTHTFSGTFTRTLGTINLGTSTLRLGGIISGTGGAVDFSQGTVDYYRGSTQTIVATTYNNLILSGTSAKTVGNTTVNGVLSLEGTASVTLAGTLTYGPTATLKYNKTTGFTAGAEWITPFDASGGIIIDNIGAIAVNTAKDINAPLTINAGASLSTAYNLNLSNDMTCDGTFTSGTSTTTFDGSTAQSINGTSTPSFYNLIVSNTAAALAVNTNISVSGNLTVNNSAILSPEASKIISGSGTLTGNGTVQVTRTENISDFNNQYTIANKTLSNLTIEYIGAGNQTVSAVNYKDLIISPNGAPRMVTLANAGFIGVSGIFSPSVTNINYTSTGSTIDFNGSSTQTINAFSYYHLTLSGAALKQLSGTVAATGNITIGTGTTLDVTSSNFGVTVGGNWNNNGGTFIPGNGTVTFNGTGTQAIQGSAVAQTFNNLTINKSVGTTINLPVGSTSTLSANSLVVNQGILQINNNTENVKRTINISGDLTVQSGGSINTGTGNPNTSGYALPGNMPPVGQYHSIFHELIIGGNFINNGTVRFTNLTVPNYAAFTTTGAVTVRFTGMTDNIATLNGVTDFYNLVVDKGSDKTYILTVSSANVANFSLYGPNLLGRVETSPFTPDNPEIRKALWIKNGTLKLTGNIMIPTLSEGNGANGNGDYAIGGNAQLWIAGPNVTVYTTATAASGFPQAPTGATGVLTSTDYQAISVYGVFRISDGFFGTRNSAGFVFWDTSNSSAEVFFEGGLVNASVFREGVAAGKASYRQTGGTVIVRGDEGESGELAAYPLFDISNVNSSFVMSGGELIIRDRNTGNAGGGNGFFVNSSVGNYSVTGGTITIETNPANTASVDIKSTANFWNLNIKRLASTTGTSTVNLLSDLVVANNLTIEANANLSTGTGNFPVTVSRDFRINSGGTYTPGTNTTTFDGAGNYYLWNDGTITSGLYNLTSNKTLGTLIFAGTASDFTVRNDLTIARDTLADGGKNIYVQGNVINNGTHQGAGKISLNKTNGAQVISGNGTGKFRNLELNNTNGAAGSVQVSLAANIVITGNLSLTSERVFDISTYLLTLDKLGGVIGTASNTRFIRTTGAASDGGIKKIFNNTSPFIFPFGSGTNYTPATLQVNSAPSVYGSVTIKPVSSQHPLVTDPASFNYYWKVEESGFSGVVAGSASLLFNYGVLPDNTSYIPGRYNPVAWSYTNDVTLVDEGNKLISFLGTNSFVGDYTAGIPACFGVSTTYYSRTNGDWSAASTWSTVGFGGIAASSIPGATSPVLIGDGNTYNHTVTVSAGSAVSGSLSLKQGSTLDLGSTSGNNFGIVASGSTGTLRISSNTATAIFPAGDFGNFLGATGGTVEYYTSGSQDFVIPVTSASPSSSTISNYYNLHLTPQSSRQITMPNSDIVVYNNMTVQGASVTGLVNLNSVAGRNLSINNNLNVNGGNLLFKNGFSQALTVSNSLSISSGAIFDVSTLGTAVNNSLSIGGNLTNNGIIDMSAGSGRLCAVTFTGSSDAVISGTGATSDFYSINVNKGTSTIPVLDVSSSAFTFSNNTTPLTLTNGTFRLTSPVTVTLSSLGFSIPSTTRLSANGGTLLIATAANDAADIDLAGILEVKAGAITVGTASNVFNNDIVYAAAGNPTIDVQNGTLFVNGQIRRNISNSLGSLIYKQAGTSSVTINGRNSQAVRAKLEVANDGHFEMASASTLTIVRGGGGATYNDLYLMPATSAVTGGTVIFGNASTEIANQAFSMNSAVPLNNLTVDGSTTSKTVALSGNNLTLLGNLTINPTSVFNANSLNVTIGGNFTNLNTDANTGVTTGGYRPGSLAQVTTFNSPATNQIITGVSANLTNFANLVINNTNTSGTVSLAVNSVIRVNNSLTLTQGTFADGSNIITVLGNISNSAAHTGTGRIDLAGPGIQVLSGNGLGKFGNLRLNNAYDVQMTASQEITGVLTFNTKYLDIGSNLLKLSNTSAGATTGSTATSHIKTSGQVTDLGVQKSYPASALNYTFPIGVAGKYTPALINVTANSAIGTITVIPVNAKHSGTTDPLEKQLNYHWIVRKTGFSSPTATHAYTYVAGDVSGNEASYVARRYNGAMWDATNSSLTVATHTANFTGISYVEGDFTAGELSEFGAVNTYYSRVVSGDWDNGNSWSTVSHNGAAAGSFPNGQPVIIASGHTIAANGPSRNAYSIDLSGVLDLAGNTGHNLGTVNGTGTIKLSPAISGNFTSPAGDFSVFTSTGGGTFELNNTSGTASFPLISTYNHLLLSGNGSKQMINSDITVNGNITNSSGSTFINSGINKLVLLGNWVNNGTYTHNNGNIEFNGNTTISGTSATTFNNMTILPDKTLVGASAGFNVAGNWINNGIYTHNSGTVNFSGTSTISGSAVTTFYHININSTQTLTGKLNGNIIVQGNWVNNGTFNHNGGSVTFAGSSAVSGTSVTTFGNVVISGSSSLTAPSVMNVSLNYTNNGSFSHNNGKMVFNGTTQTIGGTVPTLFNNLEISTGSTTSVSTSGHTLYGILLSNGTLSANGNLTLLSTSGRTALIDGSGTGNVTGDVIIQRYLTSGFGYKYFSSPFSNATVGNFSGYVDLSPLIFPRFYRYDENRTSAGWIKYIEPAGQLAPMHGYAVNLGPDPASTTLSITGTVNNGTLVPITLTNHSHTYTNGFNLIGNPYPSPIDWDAASGWTKTNVDNAIYFFNASGTGADAPANDSLQFQGTYSSYVNGIPSGNADNIIPAMQGFFVHVSTIHPVDATIIFNNGIRVNNLNPVFKSMNLNQRSLLRLNAGFEDEGMPADPAVIYFDDMATPSFDRDLDALKMMNTDARVPNLYALSQDGQKLSISGIPYTDSISRIPLGLKTALNGWVTFNAPEIDQMPSGLNIYLVDAITRTNHDLKANPKYRVYLKAGGYVNRFSLVFSYTELTLPPLIIDAEKFTVSPTGGVWTINLNLAENERGILQMVNMLGQVKYRKEVFGNETIEMDIRTNSGVYIISLISGNKSYSKKIIIQNQ